MHNFNRTSQIKFHKFLPLLFIILTCILVYVNSLNGDFVCDDVPMIVETESLHSIKYLPGYFTKGVWYFSSLVMEDLFLYRPLFLFNLFINYQLWGSNPLGFHITNLLLHIGNSILVYLFIKRILQIEEMWPPLIGSIIFAVHPIHVEAVSWIHGVNDLLLTFLFLLSFLFYLRYKENYKSIFFIISIVFFILSLLTKEVAIIMPVVVFFYDYINEKKIYINRVLIFASTAVLYMVLRAFVLGKTLGTLKLSLVGVKHVFALLALYVKFLFIPFPLGFKFEMPSVSVFTMSFSCIVCAIMVYLLFRYRRLFFPVFWLFISLIPPLTLAFYSRPIFADRFLYLPSVGFAAFLAGLISILIRVDKGKVLFFSALAVIGSGIITVTANCYWKNDEIFYRTAIKNSPHFEGAYTGLARYYERKRLYEKALNVYIEALNHVPKKDWYRIYDGIAFLYAETGLVEKSIYYYKKELETNPNSSSAFVGLGNNYWFKKDYDNALRFYIIALTLDGKNYEACYNLALLHEYLGEKDKAVYYYRKFINNAPHHKYSENIKRAKKILEKYSRSQ